MTLTVVSLISGLSSILENKLRLISRIYLVTFLPFLHTIQQQRYAPQRSGNCDGRNAIEKRQFSEEGTAALPQILSVIALNRQTEKRCRCAQTCCRFLVVMPVCRNPCVQAFLLPDGRSVRVFAVLSAVPAEHIFFWLQVRHEYGVPAYFFLESSLPLHRGGGLNWEDVR